MSTYAPSESWEAGSRDTAMSDGEYFWEPTGTALKHALACPTAGISVTKSGKGWKRLSCTGCDWFSLRLNA